jgi:hypothetical protein
VVLLVTIIAMAVLMCMMAVGVILGGRRLRGSCGGVGGEDCICDENGRPILDPDCDDDIHSCDKDPATCAFATKACELRHSHSRGGLLAESLRAVTGTSQVDAR